VVDLFADQRKLKAKWACLLKNGKKNQGYFGIIASISCYATEVYPPSYPNKMAVLLFFFVKQLFYNNLFLFFLQVISFFVKFVSE